MEHMSQRAIFIIGCVMVVAILGIAMLLLGSFASETPDPRRARLLLRLRTGAQVLTVAAILTIAWLAKGA